MRKITLLLFLFAIHMLSAQNVFEISWEQGINPSVTSPLIEVGDTVRWTWTDGTQKSVSSLPNGAERFDSGMMTLINSSFSHTFLKPGVTEYQNEANPSMKGRVTVVNKLSIEEKFVKNLNFYPNPVRNNLIISSLFKIDSYQIFNVLGTLVSQGKGAGTYTQVDMSRLNSGLYFVKVTSNNLQVTLKIAKQ